MFAGAGALTLPPKTTLEEDDRTPESSRELRLPLGDICPLPINPGRAGITMKIACLQFAPQVGRVSDNIARADAILSKADPEELDGLDVLVLPELAFSGMIPWLLSQSC